MGSLGKFWDRLLTAAGRLLAGDTSQRAEASGEDTVVVRASFVVPSSAHLTLTRYLNRRAPREQPAAAGEAAALLSPYAVSVDLVGREPILKELRGWLHGTRPISVRVLTAPAGAGKTRLALHLCDRAIEAGWDAGFLPEAELARFCSQRNLASWGWRRPTLIVIDYAASRSKLVGQWLIELAERPDRKGKPLRLLLLERHADPAGGWWCEAFGYGGGNADAVQALLDPATGPYALPPLAGSDERRAVLASILERIGSPVRPPEPGASPGFDRHLAEIAWGGEPLFLLMAGLTAAEVGFEDNFALSTTALGLHTARHEVQRIREIARQHKLPEGFLAHLAALTTLCQGLGRRELLEIVPQEAAALGYGYSVVSVEVYRTLATALPSEGEAVAPILPDVIGEAVILEALGDRSREAATGSVLRAASRAGERVLATLVRLAQDYGADRPEPLTWLEEVSSKKSNDMDFLVRLVDLYRDLAPGRPETLRAGLAMLLNSLANRLSSMGAIEEARQAVQEAVSLHRDLAASQPHVFRPDLARSLDNLSRALNDLGEREAALSVIQETVALYRDLASGRPEAFRPELAMSLSDVSNALSILGRREEALSAIQEAVALYRDLESGRPEAFGPELAMSLNDLSYALGAMDRREEALSAAKEAVALYRDLASRRPAAFRPGLASSLHNLATRLNDLGRSEKSLRAVQEAVAFGPEPVGDWDRRRSGTRALEQILIGRMMEICGEANQIFRTVSMFDCGVDGEVEFCDDDGHPSGRKIYVQLKSGASHLRSRKRDAAEVFDVKNVRHLEYWTGQPVDVYLVIRDATETIRWMNVTRYLKERHDRGSRQIVFQGERLDSAEVRRVRDQHFPRSPRQQG